MDCDWRVRRRTRPHSNYAGRAAARVFVLSAQTRVAPFVRTPRVGDLRERAGRSACGRPEPAASGSASAAEGCGQLHARRVHVRHVALGSGFAAAAHAGNAAAVAYAELLGRRAPAVRRAHTRHLHRYGAGWSLLS